MIIVCLMITWFLCIFKLSIIAHKYILNWITSMEKRTFSLLMSLFLVLYSPSIAEEHGMATYETGLKIEHVTLANDEYSEFADEIAHNKYNETKERLIREVDSYIDSKVGDKIRTYDISKHIVNECLDNDIDICFVLAQAKIETAFGTTGIGRTRRSMYGVYITFKTHNSSTSHYISMLKDNYLGSKKTIHDLMRNFVNLNGHRYSSSKTYERKLRITYNEIKKDTKIFMLQNECSKHV